MNYLNLLLERKKNVIQKFKHVFKIKIQFYHPGCRVGLLSPIGSKIDFLGGPYFWISFMIFRYYPEIHFYAHFWNPNSGKNSLAPKNFIRRPNESLYLKTSTNQKPCPTRSSAVFLKYFGLLFYDLKIVKSNISVAKIF